MANVGTIDAKVGLDLRDLEKGRKKAIGKFKSLSKDMTKMANRTSLVVGTALGAIGVSSIKLASDFEETQAKFDTAFRGVNQQAESLAKNLSDNFNMSSKSSKELLSSTGDLLKGFGFAADEALNLSNKTQQLAADLASYNNLQGGATRASQILTKAWLGERDALTSLGIKVLEADVKQKLLKKGQENLTGQALMAAKAQATFELAVQQSGDAIGDMARTSDSFANQMRKLRANTEDLRTELGMKLLPVANKIITAINDMDFDSIIENETLKRIGKAVAGFAGIVAIIGGIATAIALVSNPLVQLGVLSGVVAKLFKDNFGGLRTVFEKVGEWITKLIGRWTKFQTRIQVDVIQQDIDALNDAADRFEKLKTDDAGVVRDLIDTFSGDRAVEKKALKILNENTKSGLFGDTIEKKHIKEIEKLYRNRNSALEEEKKAAIGAFENIEDMTFEEIGKVAIKETADNLKSIGASLGVGLKDGVMEGLVAISDAIGVSVEKLVDTLGIEIPKKVEETMTKSTGRSYPSRNIRTATDDGPIPMPEGFSQAGITGGMGEKQGDVSLKGMEKFRHVIENIDQKTKQAASSLVSAMGPVAEGLKSIFTGDVVGGLGQILAQSDQFAAFMEKLSPVLQEIANIVGAVLVPVLEMLLPVVKLITKVFKEITIVFLDIGKFWLKGIKTILGGFQWLINGIIGLINKLPFVDIGKVNLTKDTQQGIDKIDSIKSELRSGNEKQDETTKAVKDTQAALFNLGNVNVDIARARSLQGLDVNVNVNDNRTTVSYNTPTGRTVNARTGI